MAQQYWKHVDEVRYDTHERWPNFLGNTTEFLMHSLLKDKLSHDKITMFLMRGSF